ncbi:Inactive homolog of metal-dependent protease, putative molecular chaperone [Paramagnetospirillum magneticum AMB-1]|uniref:N(6)-L-threonylcarbamoyladenine synthase n=2 Tax=Paramagnetospirillum magneticum TaxID=84159 RepID=Q2VYR5_PARM1|nr:Inactive homolog of metal-dependent protease, putative molecular chaperone [Paramagnetospirillum magneticum AMB-1]
MDSSTSACSAALWADGTVLARRLSPMARGQSEALLPMVAEVMAEAGLSFADLGLLAVTVGPGAFTGLRIGLAAARGLALATGLPLVGVTTTEAVAAGVPETERQGRAVLVAIESRRDEKWLQLFDSALVPLSEIRALCPEQAAQLATDAVVAGDAAPVILSFLPGAVAASSSGFADAALVAALAAGRWNRGDSLPPEPLYLRDADVTLPGRPATGGPE